jgi:Cu+-exporting ATPase
MEAVFEKPSQISIPFEPGLHSVILTLEGMSCASCAARIERKLKTVPGVREASVNFAAQKAYVGLDPVLTDMTILEKAVEEAGYGAKLYHPNSRNRPSQTYLDEQRRWGWRLMIGALFASPFLVGNLWMLFQSFEISPGVQFILALPVYLLTGWPFHQSALKRLGHGEVTMDTLVSLGSTVAFTASLPALAGAASPLYFDASALIILFVALGRYLESITKRKASQALELLMDMRPKVAHVLKEMHQVDVPVEAVGPGDTIYVRPGEQIPVDGKVLEGKGWVNESLLTGESMPVEKRPARKVFGGTLNGESSLTLLAEEVGEKSALGRMIQLVEEAQGSKVPIQSLADRVSSIFVPIVIFIASGTWVGWMLAGHPWSVGLEHAIAVLVIACPCALGLATPVALMAGIGIAARRSILIRRASALEKSETIQTIVFDKTGTLTEGRPRLVDVLVMEGWSEDKLLRYAGSLEKGVNHPLAAAILREAMILDLVLPAAESVVEVPGAGVKGRVEGHQVAVGTKAFVESIEGVVSSQQVRANVEAYRQAGQTVSLMSIEGHVVGVFAMEDPIRINSKEVVEELKHLGLRVHLLTGDGQVVAERVAERVGVDDFRANVSPEQKMAYVRELQGRGQKVAMVGDGVNDAPALAAADLGIAMGSGTDVAKEAGDVVLMQGDMHKVIEALAISRETFRVIRQNLFWAFGYNLAAIPLAVFTQIPPSFAALAMSLSSVSVVLNAMRLYWKKW